MSWPLVRLGDIAEFINGFAFKPSHWEEEGKPIIRIQNLTDSSKPFNYSSMNIDEKYHVSMGDLLVSWSATLDVFEWDKEDALLNQHIFKVVPNNKKVNKDFLRYALKEAISEMLEFTRGSTMKHVNRGDFLGTKIPLPPLAIQKKIADVLEKADQLRKDCHKMEQELNSLAQAVFIDMFGDPVTNPKGLSTRPIVELAAIVTGNTPSRAKSEYYGSHIEWIKSGNINTPSDYLTMAQEYLSELGKGVGRLAPPGSVLMTCIAGSPECIGNIAIADREVAFNQQINALIPKKNELNTEFLFTLLKVGKKLIQAASTNSMKGMISKSKLESIVLPFPTYEEQCAFSNKYTQLKKMVNIQTEKTVLTESIFNSLMQKAFKGELNLDA